jgi:hypothetical protein
MIKEICEGSEVWSLLLNIACNKSGTAKEGKACKQAQCTEMECIDPNVKWNRGWLKNLMKVCKLQGSIKLTSCIYFLSCIMVVCSMDL